MKNILATTRYQDKYGRIVIIITLFTKTVNPVKFSFSDKNLSGMKLSEVFRNEKYHEEKPKIFFL